MSAIDSNNQARIKQKLEFVYGPETGLQIGLELEKLFEKYAFLKNSASPNRRNLSQQDTLLITYGDQFQSEGRSHLQSLRLFLDKFLAGIINTVHILPFYPYTSDDGFSVVDYRVVDPALGDWSDIAQIHEKFRLMFDAVVNHISASSTWFRGFLAGESQYQDYFIVTDPSLDLSGVTRPRALPLLTQFQTPAGTKHVWTTFSTDQIDLNFRNPQVLLEMTDTLLFYVSKGADLIRLDAIGYLWKELGTGCIHLPQTHAVVQLWRAILDAISPETLIITETNVPHRDNISYFGNGTNEAQLVYQFPLVPLVLHTLQTGNATALQNWASTLAPPAPGTTFFNFLASHDGIGVVPAYGLLSKEEVHDLVARTEQHGGKVSYKNNPDGSVSPYELNITFFDALNDPNNDTDSLETKIDRYMASQAILLSLQGVPGIYVHSLFGSSNWHEGFVITSRNRTLNRQKFGLPHLEAQLDDSDSRASQVFARYSELLKARAIEPAFHPESSQEILDAGSSVFMLVRTTPEGRKVLVAINVTGKPQSLDMSRIITGWQGGEKLLNDKEIVNTVQMNFAPYEVIWLCLTGF
jgi:sucrose phosphorylase